MREIKFRAWDKVNSVMVYDVDVANGRAVKKGYQWFNTENTVYDSELMQYTGLNDSEGNEIYEGDILWDLFNDVKYEVIWDEMGAMFLFTDGKVTLDYYQIDEKFNWDYFVVCGNVYEHKHLLEGIK